MKFFQSLMIFVLLSNVIFAQTKQQIKLLDNQKKAIAYANIWLTHQKTGTYSNADGDFEIVPLPQDTLLISCLGYKTKKFLFSNIQHKKTLFLEDEPNEMQTITISSEKPKPENLGFFNEKGKISSSIRPLPQMEKAVFIKNEKPEIKQGISTLNFNIKKREKIQIIYKVRLYACVNDTPAYSLLNKEIIITLADISKKNTVKINVENLGIVFPKEGVFVGLECMNFIHPKTKMIMSYPFSEEDKKMLDEIKMSFPFRTRSMAMGLIKDKNKNAEYWGRHEYKGKKLWHTRAFDFPDYNYGYRLGFGITVKEID